MLYYPQRSQLDIDDDTEDLRAGAHSDFGSITCLFQLPGQPGLEILTPEGQWAGVAVDPLGGTDSGLGSKEGKRRRNLPILVNIGDLLQEWTGGLLKSTRHRVVFPHHDRGSAEERSEDRGAGGPGGSGDRYSLAYFCHPCDDVVLEPVPSRLVQEHIGAQAGSQCGNDGGVAEKSITAKDHLQRRLMETYTIAT
jgi:isopenicillin N synthase-like dioxygenase